MSEEQPIIIVKKKGKHAAHHGGAWKVAYSDFITSMMCFFLVMWLVSTTNATTKKGISEYFKDPGIFSLTKHGSPLDLGASGLLPDKGYQPKSKSGDKFTKTQNKVNEDGTKDDTFMNLEDYEDLNEDLNEDLDKGLEDGKEQGLGQGQGQGKGQGKGDKDGNVALEASTSGIDIKTLSSLQQLQALGELKTQIETKIDEKLAKEAFSNGNQLKATQQLKDFLGDVEISVDGTAINIDIIDTQKTSMFPLGSSKMRKESKDALYEIASTLKELPNNFEIVGHTDARPYSGKSNYSNWELSSERANSARRILEDAGIAPSRIISVQGRADRDLKIKDDPLSPKNRRITLRMNFNIEELIKVSKNNVKEKVKVFEDINKQIDNQINEQIINERINEQINERINIKINEKKTKSITTEKEIGDKEIIKKDNLNSLNDKTNSPSKAKEQELDREQAMREIIKRNSKKSVIKLDGDADLNKTLGSPVPLFNP
ncbi:MAG: flagellar motor protein MotB [Bdellovibrionota bacterium]